MAGATTGLGGCIVVHTDARSEETRAWSRQEYRQRQMIGIHVTEVSEALAAQTGAGIGDSALVTRVFHDKPADRAGLKRFDVVVGVNGTDDASPRELRRSILETPAGESVSLKVLRAGEAIDVVVTPRSAADLRTGRPQDF